MASFDFITSADFRQSLEEDYLELRKCMDAGAFKAAHVLAGSIIEALLADHLMSLNVVGEERALRMNLADIIDKCRDAGVVTNKVADLSSAIRGYRNLIHPGRAVRTAERVDRHSASITLSLVELLVAEVADQKRGTYGLTAEQITNKLQRDSSAIAIAKHLLKDVRPHELRRLLIQVLPERHREIENPFDDQSDSLTKCFEVGYGLADDEVRTEVAQEYVRMLREEADTVIQDYDNHFFHLDYFEHLTPNDAGLVKEHLFAILHSPFIYRRLSGIGRFLDLQEAQRFVDPLIRVAAYGKKAGMRTLAEKFLREELFWMSEDTTDAATERLERWNDTFEERGQVVHTNVVRRILGQEEVPDEDDDLPF